MMKKIVFFGLCLSLVGLSYVLFGQDVVFASVLPEDRRAWDALVKAHPLPKNLKINTENQTGLYRVRISDQPNLRVPSLSKEFRQQALVPWTKIWDPVVSRASATLKPDHLKDLELITPPEKAQRVDGILPGDSAYPFIKLRYLHLEPVPPEGSLLKTWWDSLKPQGTLDPVVRLGAVGDLLPSRGVEKVLPFPGGLEKTLTDTLPLLQDNDYLFGNLEGPVTRRGTPLSSLKYYIFRFPPEVLPPLKTAGFNYLTVANNHIFDYGLDGLKDSLQALKDYGFDHSGTGMNLTEALRPVQRTVKGLPMVISSFACYPDEYSGFKGGEHGAAGPQKPGTVWNNPEGIQGLKENFKKIPGFHIVMAHGGLEGKTEIDPAIRDLYRSLIDAGADLIIGSHPHVLQGIEAYKGKYIIYSLGDFIFPDMWDVPMADESMVLKMGVYGSILRYMEFHPVEIKNTVTFRSLKPMFMDRVVKLIQDLNP